MRDLCKSVQADDDDDARSPATKKGGLRGLRSYGKAAPGSPSARKQLKLQYFRLIDRNNFHKMKHFIVGITTGKAFKDLGASRGFLCNTGLHDACNRGHSEMAEVLGESGADVNRKNMNGNTPLLCSFVSWQNLMSMKSSHGRPHTKKERLATEATVHECVRVLLKCGANPGTCVGRTESGRTGGVYRSSTSLIETVFVRTYILSSEVRSHKLTEAYALSQTPARTPKLTSRLIPQA